MIKGFFRLFTIVLYDAGGVPGVVCGYLGLLVLTCYLLGKVGMWVFFKVF